MKEDFIHFIWKSKSLPVMRLLTTDGRQVHILKWGHHNHDSGPDFLQATILIDGQKWVGNIEMHVRSTDWHRHKHQEDAVYNSVVLHVVWDHDHEVLNEQGHTLPTVELKSIVSPRLHDRYLNLLHSSSGLPCENHIMDYSEIKLSSWLQRLFIERLESRRTTIMRFYEETKQDWEVAFLLQLGQAFGLRKNQLGFLMLVRSIPYRLLAKYATDRFRLEAILYGQSGFLHSRVRDHYPRSLLKEYRYLKWKYKLVPVDPKVWNLLRMRPVSFPTVRISQLADLIEDGVPLLRRFIECTSLVELHDLLHLKSTGYWKTHFLFDKPSPVSTKRMGKSFRELLLINGILPFLYTYAEATGRDGLSAKVVDWMFEIPPEQNKIVKQWSERTEVIQSAAHSQGLVHLDKYYCAPRRCTHCSIGCHALTQIYTVSEEDEFYALPM